MSTFLSQARSGRDPVPALAVASVAGLLIAAAMAASYVSGAGFLVLVIALLAIVALATFLWPRAMLVILVLAPIADRFMIAPFMPPAARPITDFLSEGLLTVVSLVILAVGFRERRIMQAIAHPASLGVAAFVGLGLASAALNGVPPLTIGSGLFFTLDAVAIFYLCRIVGFTQHQAALAIAAVLGSVLLMAIVSLSQALLSPTIFGLHPTLGRSGEAARLGSVVENPNALGSLIEMVIPFALAGAVRLLAPGRRWALGVTALLLLAALLLTYSRGSWLGVVLGSGLVLLIFDRRVLLLAAGLSVLALGLVTFMPRDLAVGLNSDGTVHQAPGFEIVDTTGDRVGAVGQGRDLRAMLVVNAIPILRDHPLLGVGPGRYGGAAAAHADSPIHRQYGTDKLLVAQQTVDNFWLHILVEAGVLGTLAFLWIIGAVVVQLVRALRGAEGVRRIAILGILAGTLAAIITTGTTMGLEANTVAFMFWFLLGIGSLYRPAAQAGH